LRPIFGISVPGNELNGVNISTFNTLSVFLPDGKRSGTDRLPRNKNMAGEIVRAEITFYSCQAVELSFSLQHPNRRAIRTPSNLCIDLCIAFRYIDIGNSTRRSRYGWFPCTYTACKQPCKLPFASVFYPRCIVFSSPLRYFTRPFSHSRTHVPAPTHTHTHTHTHTYGFPPCSISEWLYVRASRAVLVSPHA